jgi:hypothetical protein
LDIGNNEIYFKNDELKIYRGEDFVVSKYIKIHQPTLGEICDFGEQDYYSLIYNFVATPQSMKSQLWDMPQSIDYTEITPYELFYNILYHCFSQKKTSILFGDLDFQKFKVMQRKDDGSPLLYQEVISGGIYDENNIPIYNFKDLLDGCNFLKCSDEDFEDVLEERNYRLRNIKLEPIIIDEYTYGMIVDYICKTHFIERDLQIPANNSTKMVLIEDAREELLRNQGKEYHSQLKNLISTMTNIEGFKYNHAQVWDMKINAFMDAVKRISKIKNADLLLQSGYSGFGVNLKEINKKQLDWLGELD